MALPTPIPLSLKYAWQWAASSIQHGLSGAEALRQYRAGGGTIRTEWWYESLRTIQGAIEAGGRMVNIPSPLPVPAVVFETSPFQTREKFFIHAQVSGIDTIIDERTTRWVTAESDLEMTNSDWENALRKAATYGAQGTRMAEVEIGARQLFQRGEME